MKGLKELLIDADPLSYEPANPADRQELHRQVILRAALGTGAPVRSRWRPRMAVSAAIALALIGVSVVGSRSWSVFVADLQAAPVRFEVRLAEDSPAPGLRAAQVSSSRRIYLQDAAIVTNSDIATTRVIAGPGLSEYYVGIEFNASGTTKLRAATSSHIGKLLAILLDGRVVMAPVLRSPIGSSARISDHFTRAQAERIVMGMQTK
jgi:hypothetical protein